MQKTYEIIFKDVYGGDGIARYIDVEETKISRTKSSTMTKQDIGIPVETSTDELVTEKHKQDVQTFARNSEGVPVLRLGGSYGKLWGALREIALRFYHLGEPVFNKGALPIVKQIQVKPVLVPLEALRGEQVQKLPQKLSGMGGGMITMYYDVIPEAKCQITLTYPDKIEKQVKQLLDELPFISLLNKRRATIESLKEVNNQEGSFT